MGEACSSTDEEELSARAESPDFAIIVAPHPYNLPREQWRCLARVPAEGPIPEELYWEVERVEGRGIAMGPRELDLIRRFRHEHGHHYGECLDHYGWDPNDQRDFPIDLSSMSSREDTEEEDEEYEPASENN